MSVFIRLDFQIIIMLLCDVNNSKQQRCCPRNQPDQLRHLQRQHYQYSSSSSSRSCGFSTPVLIGFVLNMCTQAIHGCAIGVIDGKDACAPVPAGEPAISECTVVQFAYGTNKPSHPCVSPPPSPHPLNFLVYAPRPPSSTSSCLIRTPYVAIYF